MKSHGWKYCSLIYYERKTLLADEKSIAYKTSEQLLWTRRGVVIGVHLVNKKIA